MRSKYLAIVKYALLLAVVAAIGIGKGYAQNPSPVFHKYTVDEGLPSSDVYHVIQDSLGYIWFATGNGVSRFDGYQFTNLSLEDGLVDNTIFEIYDDKRGRLWFVSNSGKLCYFSKGRIVNYPFNNKIQAHLPSSRGPLKKSFYVSAADEVFMGLRKFGLISVSNDGIYQRQNQLFAEGELVAEGLPNGQVLVSNPQNAPTYDIIYVDDNQQFRMSLLDLIGQSSINISHAFFERMPDSSVVFSFNRYLFRLKNGRITERKTYVNDIIWLGLDRQNKLWISNLGGGLESYPYKSFLDKPFLSILSDVQVSSVLCDRDNAYWFTTLSDGVLYSPDINVLTYTKENGLHDNRVAEVMVNKDGIYAGYEKGFVSIISGETVQHLMVPSSQAIGTAVRFIVSDDKETGAYVGTGSSVYYINNGKVYSNSPSLKLDKMLYMRQMIRAQEGGYWFATVRGVSHYNSDKLVYSSNDQHDFSALVFSIAQQSDGSILFGTINGLWRYRNAKYEYLGANNSLLTNQINSIVKEPNSERFWLATAGHGVLILGGDSIWQITTRDGLASNTVQQLFYHESGVWASTNDGLSRIVPRSDGNVTIKNYTSSNGLPSNDVRSVFVYDGKVYVGTTKGLAFFSLQAESSVLPVPKVLVTSLMINNQEVNFADIDRKFAYNQNNLSFEYVGLSYKHRGKVPYRFRIGGFDTTWVYTYNNSCRYSALRPGSYTFEVQAMNVDGQWSTQTGVVNFTILPPIWQRIWFLFLLGGVLTALFILVYKARMKEIYKRNKLLSNIALYKQQSLRQQMNPHFIFNTLNSIQLYILEKDTISSHRYLTKFARLMRMTLDNSQSPTIKLRDEIDALRLYLELEALRLEGKFSFDISVVSELLLDFEVPTLLIQPFVENAIWHGIMLKDNQSGIVKISITENKRYIFCAIHDDGIGRKAAEEIRKAKMSEHKSHGLQITSQRIDLLNSLYPERFEIKYEDLCDGFGKATGTRVTISIPKYGVLKGE